MKTHYVLALTSVVVTSLTHSLRADVVTDWNSAALNAIRIDKTPPPKSSRALAIFHVAIYDAVNGITRTHQPYLVGGHVPAVSISAAVAAMLLYVSPALGWFLAPLAPKPSAPRPARV